MGRAKVRPSEKSRVNLDTYADAAKAYLAMRCGDLDVLKCYAIDQRPLSGLRPQHSDSEVNGSNGPSVAGRKSIEPFVVLSLPSELADDVFFCNSIIIREHQSFGKYHRKTAVSIEWQGNRVTL